MTNGPSALNGTGMAKQSADCQMVEYLVFSRVKNNYSKKILPLHVESRNLI